MRSISSITHIFPLSDFPSFPPQYQSYVADAANELLLVFYFRCMNISSNAFFPTYFLWQYPVLHVMVAPAAYSVSTNICLDLIEPSAIDVEGKQFFLKLWRCFDSRLVWVLFSYPLFTHLISLDLIKKKTL